MSGQSAELVGWRGQPIPAAREVDGGTYGVERWFDLALDPEAAADRAGSFRAYVSKAGCGLERFAPEDRDRLTSTLGHFHPAQSVATVDSIVWNVFGPFARSRSAAGRRWLNEVLAAAFGPADFPDDWLVRLWHREEISVPGMGATTEVEASASAVATGGWKYLFAARWQRDFPEGVDDALTLHLQQLRYADPARSGLLVIVPSPGRYPPALDPESVFRRHFTPADGTYLLAQEMLGAHAPVRVVTWESLAERCELHPYGVELGDYLRWRLSLLAG